MPGSTVDFEDPDSLTIRVELHGSETASLALWCTVRRGKGNASAFFWSYVGLWSNESLAEEGFLIEPEWLAELPVKERQSLVYLRKFGCHCFAQLTAGGVFHPGPPTEGSELGVISWTNDQLRKQVAENVESARRSVALVPSAAANQELKQQHVERRRARHGL
jgi:hypothetical protein